MGLKKKQNMNKANPVGVAIFAESMGKLDLEQTILKLRIELVLKIILINQKSLVCNIIPFSV